MKETRKLKIRSKWSVAFVLVIAMLTSNMSVYAASQAAAEAYVEYYEETRVKIPEQAEETAELEEFISYGTDTKVVKVQGATEEISRDVSGFSWTVNPNVQMYTSYFRCYAGDEISVMVNVDPSDVYIRVGIERADGVMRYVYSKDNIYHVFSITEDGIWRVVVENTSGTAVNVQGSYIY